MRVPTAAGHPSPSSRAQLGYPLSASSASFNPAAPAHLPLLHHALQAQLLFLPRRQGQLLARPAGGHWQGSRGRGSGNTFSMRVGAAMATTGQLPPAGRQCACVASCTGSRAAPDALLLPQPLRLLLVPFSPLPRPAQQRRQERMCFPHERPAVVACLNGAPLHRAGGPAAALVAQLQRCPQLSVHSFNAPGLTA